MEASLKAKLDSSLKALRLPTILSKYDEHARLSLEEQHSYEQYLLSLSQKELEQRLANRVKYLLKQAKFPKLKTMTDYDFTKVSIDRDAINQLCHGHFLKDSENIFFYGNPGTGKTHLAMAIGRELCLNSFRVVFFTGCELVQQLVKAKNNLSLSNYFKRMMAYDLVIIDELGYIPFDKSESDLLFQFISDRYERKSVLITTNLAFSEWDTIFNGQVLASAAIDRLVHYSQIFKFDQDDSFRSEVAKKRLQKAS